MQRHANSLPVTQAVLDIELEEGGRLPPAQRVALEGLATLVRGGEPVLSEAQQGASLPLLQVELDRGHGVRRRAPLIDEAAGRIHLEQDAVLVVVDVPLGPPGTPAERQPATGPGIDLAAPGPPPAVQSLGRGERGPDLLTRGLDEHAVADLGT